MVVVVVVMVMIMVILSVTATTMMLHCPTGDDGVAAAAWSKAEKVEAYTCCCTHTRTRAQKTCPVICSMHTPPPSRCPLAFLMLLLQIASKMQQQQKQQKEKQQQQQQQQPQHAEL